MKRPSITRWRRIDSLCGQFETAWRSGERPRMETLIADKDPTERSALLAELIALEFELRKEVGEEVAVEDFLRRFPEDRETVLQAWESCSRWPGSAMSSGDQIRATAAGWALDDERYRLGKQLGAGGMGTVLAARDQLLERDLAVKVLSEHLQSRPEAIERFQREVRICAQLQHPGIIPVHDAGWMDGRPCFTMKQVVGRSLAELLQDRARSDSAQTRWLEVFERVCETLAYAHAQGVIHRDLKPANIMLGAFGEVYVIDWGLAKRLGANGQDGETDGQPGRNLVPRDGEAGVDRCGDSDKLTDNGTDPLRANATAGWTFLGDVVGTPRYMSPEQACGDVEVMDRRSDVFTLGAILCEILTGEPPYGGGDRHSQLERAQLGDLGEALTRLSACSADRELVQLTCDCLAPEPKHRPADAGRVLERLTAFRLGVQDKLRRVELEQAEERARANERLRRRRIVLGWAAGVMLLAAVIAGGVVWAVRRETAHRQAEVSRREQVRKELQQTFDEIQELERAAPADWRQDPHRRTLVRELVRRAETLAESGEVVPPHARRLVELRANIEAGDADGRLLDRLDAIRLEQAKVNPRTNKFANGRTRPLYRYAFDGYGLNLDIVKAEQAVERIRGRPPHVVEACVFGLEGWRSLFKQAVPQRQWIDAVLDGIDDHPWRRAIRQACRERNWFEMERLLDATNSEMPSVETVNLVAMELMDAQQFEMAASLLEAAQRKYPGDFWINQYLALAYYAGPEKRLEESVRFVTAALAVRETDTSYLILGMALSDLARYSEAEVAYRAAIRLQPAYLQAHLNLAETLEKQKRVDEAAECYRHVLALAPEQPDALHWLRTHELP